MGFATCLDSYGYGLSLTSSLKPPICSNLLPTPVGAEVSIGRDSGCESWHLWPETQPEVRSRRHPKAATPGERDALPPRCGDFSDLELGGHVESRQDMAFAPGASTLAE